MKTEFEQRSSSRLRRKLREGSTVYEKHYVTNDWDDDMNVIQKRACDEISLLRQMASADGFRQRLGVVRIAECDPTVPMISTFEVSGDSLENCILHHRSFRSDLRPWLTAGRWLKQFQRLSLPPEIHERCSRRDPADMVEYCDLRLKSLSEFGYLWPGADLHRSILDVVDQLQVLSKAESVSTVWVHSDFSPGNIMWDGRTITPIDFAMATEGHPLADATYLIHRMEMHQIYRPWLRIPVDHIRRAVLRGLGVPASDSTAAYRMLMIKHQICRLHTYVRRPARAMKQALHDCWVRGVLKRKLRHAAGQSLRCENADSGPCGRSPRTQIS
ncbi:MAG: phosphotransferase [Planctomycetales bacterium]|nr:phosphotransferase [Planctomycetales bacterium]